MTAASAAHTPAPWVAVDFAIEADSPTRDGFTDVIAWVSSDVEEATARANARLIAASPNMAATLLWIRENLHPRKLGRGATDAELLAISLATKVLREAGVIPTHVLTEREP